MQKVTDIPLIEQSSLKSCFQGLQKLEYSNCPQLTKIPLIQELQELGLTKIPQYCCSKLTENTIDSRIKDNKFFRITITHNANLRLDATGVHG